MHKLHMLCSRFTCGNYGFNESCHKICKGIGKKISQEEFYDACAKFFNRVIYNQQPVQLIEKLKLSHTRSTAKLGLKVYAKNNKFKKTCINMIPEVIDKIQDSLRGVKPTIFKKKLKKLRLKIDKILLNNNLRCQRHQQYCTVKAESMGLFIFKNVFKICFILISSKYKKFNIRTCSLWSSIHWWDFKTD